ncbi:hypothetical protein GOV08_00070 [Candidatus Woesearchaeota archaeon]|nr:hypothetical protein [Candidatus Woesearchaeota archaeon]
MAMPDYNKPLQGIPTDKVLEMRSAGLSNNQIIQNLQREGFTQTQVFDAMNHAEAKRGVENLPPEAMQGSPPSNPMQMQPQQQGPPQPDMPPLPEMPTPPAQGAPDINQLNSVSTEDLVEALIDEKWNDLLKDISKIAEWKDKTESKISKMEQGFEDMKKNFDNLHNAVVGKIGEYDKHILDVGAEIEAMEKVFQKVLPTFTENVNELSRVADKIKAKKK